MVISLIIFGLSYQNTEKDIIFEVRNRSHVFRDTNQIQFTGRQAGASTAAFITLRCDRFRSDLPVFTPKLFEMRNRKSVWNVPELNVRYIAPKKTDVILQSTQQFVYFLREIWDDDRFDVQEQLYAIFFKCIDNVNCSVISWKCLHTGTSNYCPLEIKLILSLALKCGADGIILAHNHPSGTAQPSDADNNSTEALRDACEIVDLHFRDHIILTRDKHYSYSMNTGVLSQLKNLKKVAEVNEPGSKKCTKCGETKPLSQFYKCTGKKDGLYPSCKTCQTKALKLSHQKHREKKLDYGKKYRKENKEKLSKYYQKNQQKIKARSKIRYEKLKGTKIREYRQSYRPRKRELRAIRRKNDPLYRTSNSLRSSVLQAFKRINLQKREKTKVLLGAEFNIVKLHIERQFKKGMNWKNYGKWHIDHIIALANAKTEADLRDLCHYTNLRPMWAVDNIKKGKKNVTHQIKLRI
jgi:DNA repair protein RadC